MRSLLYLRADAKDAKGACAASVPKWLWDPGVF